MINILLLKYKKKQYNRDFFEIYKTRKNADNNIKMYVEKFINKNL